MGCSVFGELTIYVSIMDGRSVVPIIDVGTGGTLAPIFGIIMYAEYIFWAPIPYVHKLLLISSIQLV